MEYNLADLYEAVADVVPDNMALASGDVHYTYAELEKRANRLAHYLRHLGVRCENPVGVYLNRSIEQVVAILGVMKAGGAYVPLDPDYPAERIRFMLEDSGVPVLLTRDATVSFLRLSGA